jgi:hypothetical protein
MDRNPQAFPAIRYSLITVNKLGLRSRQSSASMKALSRREIVMAGVFDVSKETILVKAQRAHQGVQRMNWWARRKSAFAHPVSPRHCERSEAIQLSLKQAGFLRRKCSSQ